MTCNTEKTCQILGAEEAFVKDLPPRQERKPFFADSKTILGFLILGVALVLAFGGHLFTTADPLKQDLLLINQPPSKTHLLGLDSLGRDVYSRLVYGTRLSLMVAAGATGVALLVGVGLGLLAVSIGGVVDYIMYGIIDLIRAMPGVLFALAMMVTLQPGIPSVILAVGIAFSPNFARIARDTYLREMASGYVAAARSMGVGRLSILKRHVFLNIIGALITQTAIILPRAIVTESVLSFLGLGVSPETPTWGRMIANALDFIEIAPHAMIAPVAALSMVTFGFAMLGDAVRLRFDPLRCGS
ncbi:MAG: ABC transporter permease [Desulfobulbaceae bacterium]|nr:MAG: ABC transporter permease [Desulfobulbaceae bacterium]